MDRKYLITDTDHNDLRKKWVGQIVDMRGNAYYGFELIHPDGSIVPSSFLYFKKVKENDNATK